MEYVRSLYYPGALMFFFVFGAHVRAQIIFLPREDAMGGAVASWLVRSTPERAVRALAGDSVLCSWARDFTLTVPLSTQVYKWVPAIY